jgi:hypothetical protein
MASFRESILEADSASRYPCRPFAAFALPLLDNIALAEPSGILSISINTGAALNVFFVKTPATLAGTVDTMRDKSFLPSVLIPHDMPFARNPGTIYVNDIRPSFKTREFVCLKSHL